MLSALVALTLSYGSFINELKALPPLPKVTISWPWPKDLLIDRTKRPLAKQLARITRSVGVRLGAKSGVWLGITDIRPELVAIHFSPYHDLSVFPEITKEWTEYIAEFTNDCIVANGYLDDIPRIIYLDYELGYKSFAVDTQLNMLVVIAEDVLDCEVTFYNYGQRYKGRELSSVSSFVHSDYYGCSMYSHPRSWDNFMRLNQTTEKYAEVIPSVSIASQWTYPLGGVRTWCDTCAVDWALGDTYAQAKEIYANEHVKMVMLWPEVMDPRVTNWNEHFIAFVKGANDGQ